MNTEEMKRIMEEAKLQHSEDDLIKQFASKIGTGENQKVDTRYQQSLQDDMQEQISDITPIKDNIDGRIAHLRDTFLGAEREYVAEVLKDESMKKLIEDLNQQPTDALFTIAQRLVDQVDSGQVPDERMEHTEKQLIVLLASIQDRVLTKDLVLTPSESHGKSR